MNPNYQVIISAKDQTKQVFDSIVSNVTKLNGAIGLLGLGVSGVGLVSLAKEAAEFADDMGDLAQQLGTTTENISALRYAASIEGLFDELQVGMQRLAKASEDVADGNKAAKESFDKLKIDPTKFNDTGLLFEEVAERLSKLPDGAQKTAIAMELLGKSGAKLLPVINQGKEGLEEYRKEAEKFGLIVSEEAKEAAGQFKDNLERLSQASKGLTLEFGNKLLPAIVDISNAAIEGAKQGGVLIGVLEALAKTGEVIVFGAEQEQRAEKIAELSRFIAFQSRQLNEAGQGSNPEVLDNIKKKIKEAKEEMQTLIKLQSEAFYKNREQPADDEPRTVTGSKEKTDAQRAAEAAAREAKNFTEKLKEQADQLGLTKTEQTAYEASLLQLTATQKDSVTASITKIQAYEREQQAIKDLADFQKLLQESDDMALEADIARYDEEQQRMDAAQASYEDFYKRLTEQNEQLNIDLITNDRKRAKAQLDLENERAIETIQSMVRAQEEIDELLAKQADSYEKQLKKIDQAASGTADIGRELGRVFSSSFEDAVLGGEDFGDTLDALLKDLERMAFQAATNPLFKAFQDYATEAVSGVIYNAKGGVYSGPGISAYSNSIVNSPTVFPFARGIGLMGEAGPEAIMPLRRTADGSLGIKANGMGGGNVTVNIIGAPSQPTVSRTQDGNGNTNIDVMFERVESYLGSRVAKGQGALADVLAGNYGMSRGMGAQG